jgi:hypothetical protein
MIWGERHCLWQDDWMRVEDYCVIAREQQYREMVKLSRASARSGGGGGYRSRGPEVMTCRFACFTSSKPVLSSCLVPDCTSNGWRLRVWQ